MVLSLRVPGAARARRIASLLQALTKQNDNTLKKSIFEYTNSESIDVESRYCNLRGLDPSQAQA
jgi:hypothetical protein